MRGGHDARPTATSDRIPDRPAWGEGERLAFEKESLGFFITGHPLERFREELAQWANATTARLAELAGAPEVTGGGIITRPRLIKTPKGDPLARFVLEGPEGGAGGPGFSPAH